MANFPAPGPAQRILDMKRLIYDSKYDDGSLTRAEIDNTIQDVVDRIPVDCSDTGYRTYVKGLIWEAVVKEVQARQTAKKAEASHRITQHMRQFHEKKNETRVATAVPSWAINPIGSIVTEYL